MAFKDLREYIQALEKHGELTRVRKEVDWDLEVGAITRLVNEKSLPSPLFEKVQDYPNFRILGAPLNTYRKLAIALGMNPDASYRQVADTIRERKKKLIKPVVVDKSKAPCKENIILGDDVDLFKLPAPMLHDGDGGRYLCTWHDDVSKDPDTGWVNWGMYRHMIASKNTMTGPIRPTVHMGMHLFRKYKPRKQPMPAAIAIGSEPICNFMGAAKPGAGVNEADIVGALREEPIELVKCETVDLEVPATTEIVIEGLVTGETDWEGPFGEFTGYSANPRDKRFVFKVTAITFRNDPILAMSCMGAPIDESDIATCCWREADIYDILQSEGIPVTGVHYLPECIGYLVAVSVDNKAAGTPGQAQRIASRIWGSEIGINLPYVVVVDDDVDVFSPTEVLHAIATKCHPYRGITRLEHATGFGFMPFLSHYERENKLGAKAVFDCTWPLDWDPKVDIPPKTSFRTAYPEDVQAHVLKNWKSYGFDKGI